MKERFLKWFWKDWDKVEIGWRELVANTKNPHRIIEYCKSYYMWILALVTFATIDIWVTMVGIDSGYVTEGNPLWNSILHSGDGWAIFVGQIYRYMVLVVVIIGIGWFGNKKAQWLFIPTITSMYPLILIQNGIILTRNAIVGYRPSVHDPYSSIQMSGITLLLLGLGWIILWLLRRFIFKTTHMTLKEYVKFTFLNSLNYGTDYA